MAGSAPHSMPQVTGLVLLALACAPRATPPAPEPEVIESERRQAYPDRDRMGPLGVPEADLPPLGDCRVWLPGRPAAQQAPSQGCGEAEKNAPPGAWVLYRPPDDERVVHIRVTDPVKRGAIIRIDIYDAEKGTYLGTKDVESGHGQGTAH